MKEQFQFRFLVFRRDHRHTWLRPYDDFVAGTWNSWIRSVNKRRRKLYK